MKVDCWLHACENRHPSIISSGVAFSARMSSRESHVCGVSETYLYLRIYLGKIIVDITLAENTSLPVLALSSFPIQQSSRWRVSADSLHRLRNSSYIHPVMSAEFYSQQAVHNLCTTCHNNVALF